MDFSLFLISNFFFFFFASLNSIFFVMAVSALRVYKRKRCMVFLEVIASTHTNQDLILFIALFRAL